MSQAGINKNPAPSGVVPASGGGTGRSSLTAHSVLIGEGTSPVNFAGPDSVSGRPLIGQGASSDPVFGVATVAGGGTGVATLTGLALASGTTAFTGVTYTAKSNFTPVLKFGGATTGITYTIQAGLYQRIGNLVFFQIWIILSSKGSASGSATITGFPVTSVNDVEEVFVLETGTLAVNSNAFWQIVNATTSMNLLQIVNNTGVTSNLSEANFNNTTQIKFSGFYFS